jgi:hypothetical protein
MNTSASGTFPAKIQAMNQPAYGTYPANIQTVFVTTIYVHLFKHQNVQHIWEPMCWNTLIWMHENVDSMRQYVDNNLNQVNTKYLVKYWIYGNH